MAEGTRSIVGNLIKTYTTFSGVDITAMFDDMTMHTLQGIAISITREKVPVYRLGSARAVSISRGKRGIAGTLQFVLFDRSAMDQLIRDKDHFYYAHGDEVNWLNDTFNPAQRYAEAWASNGGGATKDEATGAVTIDRATTPTGGTFEYNAVTGLTTAANDVYRTGTSQYTSSTSIKRMAEYMDQCYPFDVSLIAQNEYGNGAWSSVVGIEIINEGGGLSMDDLTNEQTATYIAIHRQPWTPIDATSEKSKQGYYTISQPSLSTDGKIVVNKS